MSDKPISVSYSSATRFKACPTKFYLSKQYKNKLISSALPFGKAVEEGVSALLQGRSSDEAKEIFIQHWGLEKVSPTEARPIYDNLAVEYYASDFDKNLIDDDQAALLDQTARECELDYTLHWAELFEEVSAKVKSNNFEERHLFFYNRVLWLCCKTRGITMLKAFEDKLLPKLELYKIDGKPAVQKEITIQNQEGDKVTGFIDFIAYHEDYREPIILDLKTAAYPYVSHALDTSEQLKTYVAAVGADIKSARAGYIVLLKKLKANKSCDSCGDLKRGLAKNCIACKKGKYTVTKLEGDIQFITKEYKNEELEDLLEDYMNVTVAIKNEVKFKNPASCNAFGRQCEFYSMCWGGKKGSEIDHLEEKKVLTEPVEPDSV